MDARHRPTFGHFQLRRLLSAESRRSIYFAQGSKILRTNDETNPEIFDFTSNRTVYMSSERAEVSTLTTGQGVICAGNCKGEYAYRALEDPESSFTTGIVSSNQRHGLVNHVDIVPQLTGCPQLVFASNNCLQIVDSMNNRLISDQSLDWSVNCTALSPDTRLRLVVGDNKSSLICRADDGRPVTSLARHTDYGFAAAWSPDSRQVATGNQDLTVRIWDTRMWRQLHAIPMESASCRSLCYSPVGGGKRTLVAAQAADRVSIINAQTYQSKQMLDFFGEVAGTSFLPDGSGLFVSVADPDFGGILEYKRVENEASMLESGSDWVSQEDMEYDVRVLTSATHRRRRGLGLGADDFII